MLLIATIVGKLVIMFASKMCKKNVIKIIHRQTLNVMNERYILRVLRKD